MRSKGSSPVTMAVTLVLVATALIIGVWVFTTIDNAFSVPRYTTAESQAFTNATAVSLSKPYISAVNSIYNSTHTFPNEIHKGSTGTSYTWDTGAVTMNFNESYKAGTWNVGYTYNDATANDTKANIVSTSYSGYSLGVVALVIIAAVSIIGILVAGFGRAAD